MKVKSRLTYLTFGDITDVTSAILGESDDGRGGPLALSVLDDLSGA